MEEVRCRPANCRREPAQLLRPRIKRALFRIRTEASLAVTPEEVGQDQQEDEGVSVKEDGHRAVGAKGDLQGREGESPQQQGQDQGQEVSLRISHANR